ncbi:MAG TPA: MAB_1171c family putative transporter [Umezawaea sp.]|nr:MAB_1171c family putative transporter [Umezawaea sp.]
MTCSDLTGTAGVAPSPLWIASIAVLWLVAVRLLVSKRRTPQRRAIAFTFLFVTLAATISGHSARRAFDAAIGIPDLSILVGHVFAVLAVVACLELLAVVAEAGETRRRLLRGARSVLASALAGMAVLFVLIPRQADHFDFGCWEARSPLVVVYQLLFQVCLATGFAAAVVLFGSRRLTAVGAWFKASAFLIAAGCCFGVGYVGIRMWYVVAHGFDLPYPLEGPVYGLVPLVLLESTMVLLGVGALIPQAMRAGRLVGRLVRFHGLRSLWQTLSEAAPGNVLGPVPTRTADLLSVVAIERRLYRRVIEIRDAQWELNGFVSAAMVEDARRAVDESGPDEPDLALEALLLEVARRAKEGGLPHAGGDHGSSWSGEADLDEEARRLLAIQRVFAGPWVREASARLMAAA